MQKIKFRAWDPINEEFTYWGFGDVNGTGAHWTAPQFPQDRRIQYVHEQFTGLQDSRGVDIYEGDIVKVLYGDWLSKDDSDPCTIEEYRFNIAYIGMVSFTKGAFLARVGTDRIGGYPLWAELIPERHGFVRVIGNVHEHAHLLEGKS